MIGLFGLMRHLQAQACPPGTFLIGSTTLALTLQILPLAVAALPTAFLVANQLAHLVPTVRDTFARNSRLDAGAAYRRRQREMGRASLYSLSVALPLVAVASLSQWCIAPTGISVRPSPWSGMRDYVWSDVAKVRTGCTYRRRWGGGRSSGRFDLLLRDGTELDLIFYAPSFVDAYPRIAAALDGQRFQFDARAVDPACDLAFREMLVVRPASWHHADSLEFGWRGYAR